MRPKLSLVAAFATILTTTASCSDGGRGDSSVPICDAACQDGIALRAVRETVKLVFNVALQGKPVGSYDVTLPCAKGGSARVYGTATAEAIQGATFVELTYELDKCAYLQRDTDPKATFSMTTTGTIRQRGTLASQASATTGLIMESDAVTTGGTVYDPPLPYEVSCAVFATQNGNIVSGTLCGREVGFSF